MKNIKELKNMRLCDLDLLRNDIYAQRDELIKENNRKFAEMQANKKTIEALETKIIAIQEEIAVKVDITIREALELDKQAIVMGKIVSGCIIK